MQGEKGILFQIIGMQRAFARGRPFDEKAMCFHRQFFSRIKEIECTGRPVTYVRYEGPVSETDDLVFLEAAVQKIISILPVWLPGF